MNVSGRMGDNKLWDEAESEHLHVKNIKKDTSM